MTAFQQLLIDIELVSVIRLLFEQYKDSCCFLVLGKVK